MCGEWRKKHTAGRVRAAESGTDVDRGRGAWKGPDVRGMLMVPTEHRKGVSCGGSRRNKI